MQKTKDAHAKMAATRASRFARSACAYELPVALSAGPGISLPSSISSASSTPSTIDGMGHIFSDEHVNLICSESALLSLCSDRPRDPSSSSYDLRIPPANFSADSKRRQSSQKLRLREGEKLSAMMRTCLAKTKTLMQRGQNDPMHGKNPRRSKSKWSTSLIGDDCRGWPNTPATKPW